MADHLEEEQQRYALVEKYTRVKEDAFKGLGRNRYDKGRPYESLYAISYDKLASLGVRQRLRAKYRAQ